MEVQLSLKSREAHKNELCQIEFKYHLRETTQSFVNIKRDVQRAHQKIFKESSTLTHKDPQLRVMSFVCSGLRKYCVVFTR